MQVLTKYIGFPDFSRAFLKLFEEIGNQFLRLLFGTYNRGHFSGYIGLHHMDGRCRCLQANAVFPPLPDNLRLFQTQFLYIRHNDTVASVLHLVVGIPNLVVLFFHGRELHKAA